MLHTLFSMLTFSPGDDPVHVIFSRRHEIRQQNVRTLEEQSLVTGLRNTIGMDFLWEKKWLFWTDVGDDKIYRGTILPNSELEIRFLISISVFLVSNLLRPNP